MTLLITAFAAITATVVWYLNAGKGTDYRLKDMCLMYWGAFLMWSVDAVFEYAELGAEYFTPAAEDMLNDAFLGFAAVALGLIIWLVDLLIHDPKGVIRKDTAAKQISTQA
ncbi:MAG: hypothetical protein II782_03030 [Oscillospiraceae bacterium]|nr:hypothetical protein [Oscillospiraceae bacterium]